MDDRQNKYNRLPETIRWNHPAVCRRLFVLVASPGGRTTPAAATAAVVNERFHGSEFELRKGGTSGVAPVSVEHGVMLVIENVTGDTGGVVAYPKEDIPPVLGCVFVQRVAILKGHLRPAIIFIEIKVHHAGNRIRAVGGRSAIFQNVDALNRGDRNGN